MNAALHSRNLDVSQTTVRGYLDLMVDLMLVRRLSLWRHNLNKRLVKSPKIYIRDSGITHALLQNPDFNSLLGHPIQGGSWEGFVIENLMSIVPSHVRPYYYRSSAGAEIDLILEFSPREKWAIEVKRSSAPAVTKGFHIACEDIEATKKIIIYSGEETFSIGSGIQVISLASMMNLIMRI